MEKQVAAVAALCEGASIRAIERMTGVHRDTVMRLGVKVGEACAVMHDETMRDLPCKFVEADEVWGFVGKKQKNATPAEEAAGLGDVWTFVGFDPETKLAASYVVGKRDYVHTLRFITDLASRMRSRIQLSTDGMNEYGSGRCQWPVDRGGFARPMSYLDELAHARTVAVSEVFKGRVIWSGNVEVFSLTGHARARRCYAWAYPVESGPREVITALEIPPVDSPQTAVKIVIAAHAAQSS